ncbi:acyl--CoA ligase [Streptomyces sp. NA04227]|uniref:class I adenylate-forming enzyme family protein n=1 Tax=Streptomyces sp. NA04227 TaxID=2742136 RepID=UPI001591084B|nr:class I adenylate-forming enzyme family protein [Streptomyces sp. NA04227]QKW08207.1 acyl--CoA ligase [Streptomyces sp. NA04227]
MSLPDDLPKPGKLFTLGLITQQAAQKFPDSLFYLDRPFDVAPELGLRPTYAQVAELVEDLAARLYAAGVRPGHTVAVYKSHNADILFLACAIGRVGAVPAMLAPFLEWPTVVKMMGRLKPDHFLTDPATLALAGDNLAALRASAPAVLLTHGEGEGLPSVAATVPGQAPPYPDIPEDAPALITHTSGTTGVPKLVAAARRGTQLPINTQAKMAKLLRYRETFAMCISFVHARTYAALATAMQLGIGIAPLSDPDPASVGKVLTEARPGCVEAHPNMYLHWEELAGIPDGPFERVRIFMSTFDAIHPRSIRTLLGASKRRSPLFIQTYGQTETGPVTMRIYTRRNIDKADGRCVGFVFPGMTKARIRPRPQDQGTRNGYIQARSSGVALTYVGQQELYDERCEAGDWWNLQDIGYKTRWGCVHLMDREFDQADGLDSLLAAEDTLIEALPELTEAVFVRVGETVRPVVTTRQDRPLDRAAWQAAVADLPGLAEPIHVAWKYIPHTATWKVKRNVLAAGLTDGSIPALDGVRS